MLKKIFGQTEIASYFLEHDLVQKKVIALAKTLPNIKMKLREVISNLDNINEESFLYLKRINHEFSVKSNTVVLVLNEEELEWKTNEVTERKCPGFEYFMEVFLIKEFLEDLPEKDYPTLDKKIERLIHYVEFDA